MTAHTPGPWPVAASRFGTDHFTVGVSPPYVAAVKRIEDARLIAAAPDLLAASQRVTAAFRAMGQPASVVGMLTTLRDECEASVLALDAAIAKAVHQ